MTSPTPPASVWLFALTVLCGGPPATARSASPKTLIAYDTSLTSASVEANDARTSIIESDGTANVLRVDTGHKADWPGVTIKSAAGAWDLSEFSEIALRVKNLRPEPVTVHFRVDSPGGDGTHNSLTQQVTLRPDEQRQVRIPLSRQLPTQLAKQLFAMRGYPGGVKEQGIDVSRVTQLIVFVNKPTRDHSFRLSTIRANGSYDQGSWSGMSPDEFFPMIDRFGQFTHKNWPGKTHSENDLRKETRDELDQLSANSGPDNWNQFGGWTLGPQLKATGFFYATQHDDRWWLVDPNGRLFWSHGVDCVGFSGGITPIRDREFYFSDLPTTDSPLAKFYGSASWAPVGYYHDKGAYRTLNFTAANLMRKYGDDWHAKAAALTHRRLRSWSMNTIGNWSDAAIYRQRSTPYVVTIDSTKAKRIEGSTGYWGKFPDPFDASFRDVIDRRMRFEQDQSAGDAWCIGYFVDNELAWGDERSLAVATLASPRHQAAKQVFLADLVEKYDTIARLNGVWNTSHASWDELVESRTPPDVKNARSDLGAFYTRIAEQYFRECRDAVKRIAPYHLYLGCRFAWVNDRGARAAAKYCDVIGYNLYRYNVADFRLPSDLDRPVIVGEFHFGALDRGLFHTGLRPTDNQQDRADAYRKYVTGALNNPFIVGTHWFQFGDQATTGRGDGENYQIGLVDICDKPYAETVKAVREVGRRMYKTRTRANRPLRQQ